MKIYSSKKNSGVKWIGEIPYDWQVMRLKYLASVQNSNVDKKSENGETFVLLCNYVDTYKNEKITSEINFMEATATDKEIENFNLKKGDVLITKDSETPDDIAIASYVEGNLEKVLCGYHQSLIRSQGLNGEYLFRFFQNFGTRQYYETEANGVTRYGLSLYSIKVMPTLIPSEKEQYQIINYLNYKLNLIDNLFEKNKKLIEALEERKQAMINKAVTKGLSPNIKMKESGFEWIGKIPEHWNLMKLRHLFEVKKDIARSLGYQVLSITQKGIKVKDIQDNEGQISSDYSKYQIVEKGDFAMNHMDLLTGYVDISQYKGVTSPDYRVFRLKNIKNSSQYFLHLLQICYKNRLFYSNGRGAAHFGRWRLGINEFNSIVFPVPPEPEQQEIVATLVTLCARTDEMTEKLKRQNSLLVEYRQTLISNVVTGKIDVRDEKFPEKHLVN